MTETIQNTTLQTALITQIQQYLADMKNQDVTNLHQMVLEKIEEPLIEAVMEYSQYNQSKAAEALGMSRGTFRKKLKFYSGEKYCGSKKDINNDL